LTSSSTAVRGCSEPSCRRSDDHPEDGILRSLIDNEIMLQRAEKLSLMATDTDVEAKFNELKSGYTQEEFSKQLEARKMSVADLKAQIRRDLSVQKLINKEITSQISISDSDITASTTRTSRRSILPSRSSIWRSWWLRPAQIPVSAT
jgi:peptidyl-prolyl cis-trans isomerase SurA